MVNSIALVQQAGVQSEYGSSKAKADVHRQAIQRFRRAYNRGVWGKRWSALTGRRNRLLRLAEAEERVSVQSRRDAGIRTVPIEQIRGSGGRSQDFDAEFKPLKTRTQDRRIGLAAARRTDVVLPLVDLVQIGDVYFVTDGHHRISVARSHGQMEVEAKVTVWQVTESLPWERLAAAPA